ncbi:hypothetical protein AVEN_235085-1 [Araneus ventricosus]|uniref:Uncharacterized protein n=1 Tax=Araneus ventricosus TaxID=182803 RepID=A0A4Y2NN39_ARAVE|nr:hypothetical protein AVEN_235085-1 [Araneus ventricosus]
MEALEQTARELWENTTRQNVSVPSQQETEQDNVISKALLFTWFPWFETTTEEIQEDRATKTKKVSTFRAGVGGSLSDHISTNINRMLTNCCEKRGEIVHSARQAIFAIEPRIAIYSYR